MGGSLFSSTISLFDDSPPRHLIDAVKVKAIIEVYPRDVVSLFHY